MAVIECKWTLSWISKFVNCFFKLFFLSKHPFLIEALVDFPDDALHAEFPITHRHIDAMMKALAEVCVETAQCHGMEICGFRPV